MPATEVLYGRNAVREALRARRRRLHRLLLAEGGDQRARALVDEARRAGVAVLEAPRQQLDHAAPGANHQGVALEAGPYPYADFRELLAAASAAPLYLALDQVQDPQNVGTLLRTAEAVGVTGVLLPEHRAAAITPAVVNASSGATEHLHVARVTNLARALAQLKQAGVWVAGLEAAPEAGLLDDADLAGPLALVVGSEGRGIARLVRETCDFLVRLPMRGRVASLNAAVAGSVALYAADRQRERAARH
ncbi:MAG TPA: 23S rRNA (guanosine(2251)-2'-O)-methyltransferase RlmB [Thermomicrobiales bacterium]|nr:23S rRNA (guanosine(2251)-2'-O)-methyltransferase RlmB [Thermomicrobiales bacterium]